MRYFVTGGAGFIGRRLVERLLSEGVDVVVFDNLSSGTGEHIAALSTNPRFRFVRGDLLDNGSLTESMAGSDVIFHLAANSDIRRAEENPEIELHQGIIATFNVLQAMRQNSVPKIVFSSSSTVYGDTGGQVLREDFGPLMPISFYGASKLSAEGLVCAFCHMFGMKAWIFRFANIVGRGLTHSVTLDFVRKLRKNPRQLEILGDGKQTKAYLHVSECVEGMLWALRNSGETVNIFNLSSEDAITVDEIARIVVEEMGLKEVAFTYTGGRGGWKGDVPQVRLNSKALRRLGWQTKMNSGQAVRTAVRELLSEQGGI